MIQNFFEWSILRTDVNRYVKNCHICKRSKASINGFHDPLQSIEAESRLWQNISMDFITGFSESDGFNAILMIVDSFSKMHHYIACTAGNKGTNTEKRRKY